MHEFKTPPALPLPPIPDGAFANWIYLSDWNTFIYLAAHNAHFRWLK